MTLAPLGDVYHDTGHHAAATRAWRRALCILEELGLPDASQIRDRLERLGHSIGGPPADHAVRR